MDIFIAKVSFAVLTGFVNLRKEENSRQHFPDLSGRGTPFAPFVQCLSQDGNSQEIPWEMPLSTEMI